MKPRNDDGTAIIPETRRIKSRTIRCPLLVVLLFGVVACGGGGGGGGGGDGESPPPPDLSGVWAGTWEGTDPMFGRVTGTWEVEAGQTASGVTGVAFLDGDVDCAEGPLEGTVRAGDVPRGVLARPPCPGNEWTLTALDLATRTASGLWTKPETGGAGSFTGTQVATPGGPRVRYFSPMGGGAGTVITIVGSGLGGLARTDLVFGTVPANRILSSTPDRVVAVVPQGVPKAPLFVTTAAGLAISSRHFGADAGHPSGDAFSEIFVGAAQEGIATSPDGRRVFVASSSAAEGPAVFMLDVATRQIVRTTPIPCGAQDGLRGLAMTPDGRRLYVACGSSGVAVLHGVTGAALETLPTPSGAGPSQNPQGLAVSPDGKLLFVADGRDGGSVRVLDRTQHATVATIPGGEGLVPTGVAVARDGLLTYLAFSSLSGPGTVSVFDNESRTVVGTIPVGSRPMDIAVTPDGRRLYVASEFEGAVSVIDTRTGNQVGSVPVGALPKGIAITPDGQRLLVTNGGAQSMTVADIATGQVVTMVPLPASPFAIALSPDGNRAYVTYTDDSWVSEWGSSRLLSIAKGGTGIGTVTSYPGGIECGSSCQESFSPGTVVQLTASPYAGSTFAGWGGDPDCSDGIVTLGQDVNCSATFSDTGTGGSGSGGGGGCFLQSM